ncbi:MAG TPA: hypothetical protein VJZ71_20115 [Phycisphaerae bacterium]|nr:hypothetical protein [Phycisphaerae bacterium]
MAEIVVDPRSGSFKDWTDRYRAENEYIKALGEYKLNEAKASLEKANAAKKWKEVELWTILIKQLDRDFKRFNNAQMTLTKKISQMQVRSRNASLLLKGARMDGTALSNAWRAYTMFERNVLDGGDDSLFDMMVPAMARRANNFVNNVATVSKPDETPSDVENAVQFMAWLKEKKYVAVKGSPAQRFIVKLFKAINQVPAEAVQEMRDRIESIRKGTYDAWNPKGLLGASSDAAKKIEEAKPKG